MRIRTHLLKFSLIVLVSSVSTSVFAEDQPMLVTVKRMSMEVALTIAHKAIEACREEGIQIGVTVVDRNGLPQVMLRDVLASDLTMRISERKAYSALTFNLPTGQLEGRFKGAYSVPSDEKMIVAQGGLPIRAAGHILGGVGVSGAPSGEIDEKCAKAGLQAVLDDLEMAE